MAFVSCKLISCGHPRETAHECPKTVAGGGPVSRLARSSSNRFGH